jgi:hypothetical protein
VRTSWTAAGGQYWINAFRIDPVELFARTRSAADLFSIPTVGDDKIGERHQDLLRRSDKHWVWVRALAGSSA